MASVEEDTDGGEDALDQLPVVDSATRQPTREDHSSDETLDYNLLFRGHVDSTRGHLLGETSMDDVDDEPGDVEDSADGWTLSEKDLFFHALTVYSRWRPDLIASSIRAKSTLDVCLYIDRLEEGILMNAEESSLLHRDDFPCAHEMSDDWIEREEYEATVYTAYELDAEEKEKQAKRKSLRKRSHSPSSSDCHPTKKRRISPDEMDEELELAWEREDELDHLDTWVLKRMAYLLNTHEDGSPLSDGEEDDEDLDPTSTTHASPPPPTSSPHPSSPYASQSTSHLSRSQSQPKNHRPSTPTDAETLASLSPRSRRRYKNMLFMRRTRGDATTDMKKRRRGPRAKPPVVSTGTGRGRGRPRTRNVQSKGARKGQKHTEEVDENHSDDDHDHDEDEDDEDKVRRELRPRGTDQPNVPSSITSPTTTAPTPATESFFMSVYSLQSNPAPAASSSPLVTEPPAISKKKATTRANCARSSVNTQSPSQRRRASRPDSEDDDEQDAHQNDDPEPDQDEGLEHDLDEDPSHDHGETPEDDQEDPESEDQDNEPLPRPSRRSKPSGPTQLQRAQRRLDALGVTADYLVDEGLGLFHLGRVSEMVNLHYSLNSPLNSSHLASDTSVGLSAPALRVMEALVVDFVEGVVQAAVVNREMEGAQKRSAVWNRGKGKGKARSRSRAEDDDNDGDDGDDDEQDEDEVQRVTRTNIHNALDKLGVTREGRTRKGYLQRLMGRLRERRDAGAFENDEEELVFSDDDADEDEDEDDHHPSSPTDAELIPVMHPLPVSLSSLFERSLSYTTPLLRPIVTGQSLAYSQSYSQAYSQHADVAELMDPETDEEAMRGELEEEEELDQLDADEDEAMEGVMWAGVGRERA